MSTWEIIKAPGVPSVLYLYGHIMLLALAYTAGECFEYHLSIHANINFISVLPVFWFTSVELGGFGFSPLQISIFLGIAGLSQAIWLLVAFPPLQHRFGTGGVLRSCSVVWPVMFAFTPVCTVFLRHGWNTAFWISAPIALVVGSGVAMAFSELSLPIVR